jgi:hypothetical protein
VPPVGSSRESAEFPTEVKEVLAMFGWGESCRTPVEHRARVMGHDDGYASCATSSSGVHHLEEQQLRCGRSSICLTPGRLGVIHHHGVFGR